MKYLDVITAFLERHVNEEIYMTLFKRVVFLEVRLRVGSGIPVHARLLKSLYSLKQASVNQFDTLDNFLLSIYIQKFRSELRIYVQRVTDNQARKVVVVSIDDKILFGNNDRNIEKSL